MSVQMNLSGEPPNDAGGAPPKGGQPSGAGARASRMPAWPRWLRRDGLWPDPGWARREWKGLTLVAVLVVAGLTFNGWLATCGFDRCPTPQEIRAYHPAEGGRILDRRGRQLGQVEPIRRINVPLSAIPAQVQQAFLAVEDRRFHEHQGVDWRGVMRATVRNVAALGVREGFSTITMQVARNTYLARRFPYTDRSLQRKLIELRITALLERALTKEQILELYLNTIYLGNGTYGVEATSRDLFGRSVEHLTLPEGAVLAALPKGPSAYTPRRYPERARARRDLVLSLMAREGYVTAAEAQAAARRPLKLAPVDARRTAATASYALDLVRATVDSLLRGSGFETGDIVVRTTLDADAQQAAQRAVARQADAIQRESGRAQAKEKVEGAFVALDPRTGGIVAMVGGREHQRGAFNRATSAHRQPGSAFKPFVYAAALGAGFTPTSLVDDAPIEVQQGTTIWRPANSNGVYLGRVTMRTALARSSNSAAVRVAQSVGERSVVDRARRNGIASPLSAVPAIALGALEVTPLELVTAYAPFANGGNHVTPHVLTRIETADGTVLWSGQPRLTPVMDARDAFQLTSMLRSVVDEGTARSLRGMGVEQPVAGKTGTTNNGADVWFVGYTPSLVAGVWFGYDTPRSLGDDAAGGRYAAPAWAEFYRDGWRDKSADGEWPVPDGLIMKVVDAENGLLADEWCPWTRREWYKPGTEPTSYCDVHFAPYVDDPRWYDQVRERIGGIFRGVIPF
ncbi:MAG TPA: PBP1A family penicillin-binding protein [Gemmatimonadaceae bacterium]|nr:PBP1A family penicillin-binding protein [Gemmatimonadaceae bacterium]